MTEECSKCGETVRSKDYPDHLENCSSNYTDCRKCGENVLMRDYSDHLSVCPKNTIECSCCGTNVLMSEFNDHVEECVLKKCSNLDVAPTPVESTSTDASEFDFNLDFGDLSVQPEAPASTISEFDFNLDLIEAPASTKSEFDFSFDFGGTSNETEKRCEFCRADVARGFEDAHRKACKKAPKTVKSSEFDFSFD